MKVYEEWR